MESPATEPESSPIGFPRAVPRSRPSRPAPEPETPSPARDYRRRRDRNRALVNTAVYPLLILGLLSFTGYYAENANGPGSAGAPVSLPPVTSATADNVTFGTPSLHTTTCGDGRNTSVEWVPWVSARTPPVTSQVFMEVVEQLDGDIDGGPEPVPSVNATSVCEGAPLSTAPSWYVVLRAPGGENVAAFSYTTNWMILGHSSSVRIANGSTFLFVADPELSGASLSLCVVGDIGALSIQGCVDL
jgi:hypothetical protein